MPWEILQSRKVSEKYDVCSIVTKQWEVKFTLISPKTFLCNNCPCIINTLVIQRKQAENILYQLFYINFFFKFSILLQTFLCAKERLFAIISKRKLHLSCFAVKLFSCLLNTFTLFMLDLCKHVCNYKILFQYIFAFHLLFW